MILLYVTCRDKKEAVRISMHLLKRRMIACSNIFPIDSLYWWKGKITKDKEYVALLKTQGKNFLKLKKEIEKIHSYDIPCIERINTGANKKFEKWVIKETK